MIIYSPVSNVIPNPRGLSIKVHTLIAEFNSHTVTTTTTTTTHTLLAEQNYTLTVNQS